MAAGGASASFGAREAAGVFAADPEARAAPVLVPVRALEVPFAPAALALAGGLPPAAAGFFLPAPDFAERVAAARPAGFVRDAFRVEGRAVPRGEEPFAGGSPTAAESSAEASSAGRAEARRGAASLPRALARARALRVDGPVVLPVVATAASEGVGEEERGAESSRFDPAGQAPSAGKRNRFTLTDLRPGIDAHCSSWERRILRTPVSRPQMGRQNRRRSIRARTRVLRTRRSQDAQTRERLRSQDLRSDSTEPGLSARTDSAA